MSKTAPVFEMFNYGSSQNMAVYGQPTPPIWDLADIDKPLFMYVGMDDDLGDPTDNLMVERDLDTDLTYRTYAEFDHMTFLWGGENEQVETFLDNLVSDLLNIREEYLESE